MVSSICFFFHSKTVAISSLSFAHNLLIWVWNHVQYTCSENDSYMTWSHSDSRVQVCQKLNKLYIGCLLQRGKQFCWRCCNPHKSNSIKRQVCPKFLLSQLPVIFKKDVSLICHIGQLIQIILIIIFQFDQWKTKLYFIYPLLLFTGFCVHKWGHKL